MAIDSQLLDETTSITHKQSNAGAPALREPSELAEIVEAAEASEKWIGRVRLCKERRWYERLHHGVDYDLWVISWLPGQSTGFHDHGTSAGAYVVAMGELEELRSNGGTHTVGRGQTVSFSKDFAHDVRNASAAPAVSIHAYSPPLTEMNHFELDDGQFILNSARRRSIEPGAQTQSADRSPDGSRVERVLSAARSRLRRISPHEALDAAAHANAVLVDVRPASQRAAEGGIPGAIAVERNVLEWRFDPSSDARLPIADSPDLQVIVFCSQGYASSFAAADLQDIGLWRATDIIGGFQAWRDAGLPTTT